MDATILLLLLTAHCLQTGLTLRVTDVSLTKSKKYLFSGPPVEDSVLECQYDLEEAEEVKKVSWFKDNELVLTWNPAGGSKSEGSLMNKVSSKRSDGHLQFTKDINLSFAGLYRCEVETSEKAEKSPDYQLLIISMPSRKVIFKAALEDCKIKVTFESPPVAPLPTVVCGAWKAPTDVTQSQRHGGYVFRATGWEAIPASKGMFQYKLDEAEFEVRQMPLLSAIKCEIGIRKVDDTFVTLYEEGRNFTEISERGCRAIEVAESAEVSYENHKKTCRKEFVPKDRSKSLMAKIKCKAGYTSSLSEGAKGEVQLVCQGLQWHIINGVSWDDLQAMKCYKGPKRREEL